MSPTPQLRQLRPMTRFALAVALAAALHMLLAFGLIVAGFSLARSDTAAANVARNIFGLIIAALLQPGQALLEMVSSPEMREYLDYPLFIGTSVVWGVAVVLLIVAIRRFVAFHRPRSS